MATSPLIQRSDSVAENMPEALRQSRYHMKKCFAQYTKQGKRLLKIHQLIAELEKTIDDPAERNQVLEGTLGYVLCSTQEAAVVPPYVAFAVRSTPGYWEHVKVHANDLTVESISVTEYLKLKESIYDDKWYFIHTPNHFRSKDESALEIDFGALDYSTPRLSLSPSIGNGLGYTSKFLSTRLYGEKEAAKPLVDYLLTRYIADTRGAFVQPALYEAFGLTVIEAMNCGLPTFATNQGGPAEIIVDGVSGFHVDPIPTPEIPIPVAKPAATKPKLSRK